MDKFDRFKDKFPGEEQQREQLCALMDEWREKISEKDDIIFYDNGEPYPTTEYFTADGFYPNYFRQETKVLFIARETRYGSSSGYWDDVIFNLDLFKRNERLGKNAGFWRRLLYIVYGIKNEGKIKYKNVPDAKFIAQEMQNKNDFGFALMNISKYSNDRDDGANADYKLIKRFIDDSEFDKRNFISEELELLSPDVIITANLWNGKIEMNQFNELFEWEKEKKSKNKIADLYEVKIKKSGKPCKIIDLYHFAAFARGINEKSLDEVTKDYFYDPVMELLFGKK